MMTCRNLISNIPTLLNNCRYTVGLIIGPRHFSTNLDYGNADAPISCDRPRVLITGALGQIGKGLASLIRSTYGKENVIMSDIVKPPRQMWTDLAPYLYLDILDASNLEAAVVNYQIDWIIHFSAILSAVGEDNFPLALKINTQGVQNVLQVSNTIGAFGSTTPKHQTPDITIQRPRTIYGVSKVYAELLGEYMHEKFNLDFRSLRFPGVISATKPGGGTTDYAIKIFYDALTQGKHVCYLCPDTRLPMMFEEDCLQSVVQFMEAPEELLTKRIYNISAMSFTPEEIASEIKQVIPNFEIEYEPCPVRHKIADSWPESLDDSGATSDWSWKPQYNLTRTVDEMLSLVKKQLESVKLPEEALNTVITGK